ncbi:glycosyltransferase family 4 protein [Halorussus litoreus]|uniref:glycosyltransferase family 4 protein n=1 Tax=Halorussus litoreus TaxID=1710536 RepID=UPI0018E53121|nr:glycosyltransferase family 4 protein [Halorussus litoreus]
MTQTYPPEMGGNASRIGDTTRHLADEGWDVTVLAPFPSYPPGQFEREWSLRRAEEREGVEVHRLWSYQPTEEDPEFAQRLAYYLTFALHAMLWVLWNGGRFDAVLASTPPMFTALVGLVGKLAQGLYWVTDVRDFWVDPAAHLDFVPAERVLIRASRLFERAALSTSDLILTTTPEMRSQLLSRYSSIDPDAVTVIPNGVDASRFAPTDASQFAPTDESAAAPADVVETGRFEHPRESGESECFRESAESRVVYTGNLGHAQDLECCVRAMQYVETDLMLTIVGDGDRRSALERLVAELDLGDAVDITGPVDRSRVPKILDSSLLGVAPTDASEALSYAVPTKAYEYMASELPVVVTGTGAVERLVAESAGGVAADDDPVALAATFDELATDDERRWRLGRNGRQFVERHRDRRQIARKLADQLEVRLGLAQPERRVSEPEPPGA